MTLILEIKQSQNSSSNENNTTKHTRHNLNILTCIIFRNTVLYTDSHLSRIKVHNAAATKDEVRHIQEAEGNPS